MHSAEPWTSAEKKTCTVLKPWINADTSIISGMVAVNLHICSICTVFNIFWFWSACHTNFDMLRILIYPNSDLHIFRSALISICNTFDLQNILKTSKQIGSLMKNMEVIIYHEGDFTFFILVILLTFLVINVINSY